MADSMKSATLDESFTKLLHMRGFPLPSSRILSTLARACDSDTEVAANIPLHTQAVLSATASDTGDTQPILFGENKVIPSVKQYIVAFRELYLYFVSLPEKIASDIKCVLLPTFVHLYIEIVLYGEKAFADKFLSTLSDCFLDTNSQKMLRTLALVKCKEDLYEYRELHIFLHAKYTVSMSSRAFHHLQRHLQEKHNHLVIKILNLNIRVDVIESDHHDFDSGQKVFHDCCFETLPNSDLTPEQQRQISELVTNDDDYKMKVCDEEQLQKFSDILSCVRSSTKPCLPSILNCTVTSAKHCSSMTSNNDASMVAAAFEDSSLKIWSVTSSQLFPTDSDPSLFTSPVVDFTPFEEVRTNSQCSEVCHLHGHSGTVTDTKFICHQDYILTCSEDKSVRLWSLSELVNKCRYLGHNYPVWCLDTDATQTYFVTGSADTTARLWTYEQTNPVRIFVGHMLDIDSVQFHPNSSYVATASTDQSIRLWDINSGKCERLLPGVRGSIFSLCFSPCGRCLSSAGEEGVVRLWDLRSSKVLMELSGHTDRVYDLTYSSSGEILASASCDGTVKLWGVKESEFGVGSSSGSLLASYPPQAVSGDATTGEMRFYHVTFPSTYPLLVCGGYRQQGAESQGAATRVKSESGADCLMSANAIHVKSEANLNATADSGSSFMLS